MDIKLRKPLMNNGKEISIVSLDLDKLTPQDIIDSENEVIKSTNMPVVLDFNRDFCITVAARAMELPTESLKRLHVKDFNRIIAEVRNFLSDTESEQANEESRKVLEK